MKASISIILPARNEASALRVLLPELRRRFADAQILVVDDGSTDDTGEICRQHAVTRLVHPYTLGNGAAVKTGARAAVGDVLVCMDADGQHDPADIPRLLTGLEQGLDMVVGARASDSHAGSHRALGNKLFNRLASWMVGHRVADLTSGFRAVRADRFRRFLHLLPNGFSYPTTITMSFFRAGYAVGYVPIRAKRRDGRSHLHPLRDGMRFLIIILRIGTLYSPFRLFLPVSLTFFGLGALYYAYTLSTQGRFTNMSALMFTTSILTFLIGIVSEQITALHYRDTER
ncbi:MAG TPA: glycosyltransferase family 2 protein [Thiobacillaceae bacterium]|nr:glycosyltransferase family 2 protein [Thiobacillaceae bacterium]HNU64498.1 glycosyltransferase family 2 protein [Thiobacillaceae bacterium]